MAQSATKPKVLIIAGTTAVGKTDLSIHLAKRLNGEVISADSVQVYRHMDIGSAKVTRDIQAAVPHHLLDVVGISQSFSAGDYCRLATSAVQDVIARHHVPLVDVIARHHVPLVVGGTGLYIQTLMEGSTGAPPSTPDSRAMVESMVERDGHSWDMSIARLEALDPDYAATLTVNDWYRLKRALEICTLSNRSVTSFKKTYNPEDALYHFKCLFLSMPRVNLYKRIDMRCEAMVQDGLLQEVISLVKNHQLTPNCQAGRSIGYRQALEYLQSVWEYPTVGGAACAQHPLQDLRTTFNQFFSTYQARTRELAGRQLAWFKSNADFQWVNMAPRSQILPMDVVGEAVVQWFLEDKPLPEDLNGSSLQMLTREEKLDLKEYTAKHNRPMDSATVDSVLHQLQCCLNSSVT
eukprot:Em0019g762a